MEKPIIIFGAGAVGKSALEIFKSNGIIVFGFLDDNKELQNQDVGEVPVLGTLDDAEILKEVGKSAEAFIAIDENSIRRKLTNSLKKERQSVPVNAVHQSALVAESAAIGQGNLIDAGVILGSSVSVGNHCLLRLGSKLDTGVNIGDFVQIGTGSNINAEVQIEDEVFIGSGVTIVSGVTIAKGARIGAGSVVVENVEPTATVFGNPAKTIG